MTSRRSRATSNQDDGSSIAVTDAAAGFKALKSDPNAVVLSIIGPANAPRLDALLDQFPNRSAHASIEDADYTTAVAILGQIYVTDLGLQCLDTPLDVDPDLPGDQYDCTVELAYRDGTRRAALPGRALLVVSPRLRELPVRTGRSDRRSSLHDVRHPDGPWAVRRRELTETVSECCQRSIGIANDVGGLRTPVEK